eukprot:10278043-Heterocapsa_arctica.AAC.1
MVVRHCPSGHRADRKGAGDLAGKPDHAVLRLGAWDRWMLLHSKASAEGHIAGRIQARRLA